MGTKRIVVVLFDKNMATDDSEKCWNDVKGKIAHGFCDNVSSVGICDIGHFNV